MVFCFSVFSPVNLYLDDATIGALCNGSIKVDSLHRLEDPPQPEHASSTGCASVFLDCINAARRSYVEAANKPVFNQVENAALLAGAVLSLRVPFLRAKTVSGLEGLAAGRAGAKVAAGLEALSKTQPLQGKMVTLTGAVSRLLPERYGPFGWHQNFLIHTRGGAPIIVKHNFSVAPKVPIDIGDIVRIRGEMLDASMTKGRVSRLVHWTHRSKTNGHEDGWIELAGKRYL